MPIDTRLHRILTPSDGIHVVQSWHTHDLDTIAVEFDDIGKVARLDGGEAGFSFWLLIGVHAVESSLGGDWRELAPADMGGGAGGGLFDTVTVYAGPEWQYGAIPAAPGQLVALDLAAIGGAPVVEFPASADVGACIGVSVLSISGNDDEVTCNGAVQEVPTRLAAPGAMALWTWNGSAWALVAYSAPPGVPVSIGSENQEGTAPALARADHVHRLHTWELMGANGLNDVYPVTAADFGKVARLERTIGEDPTVRTSFWMLIDQSDGFGVWRELAPSEVIRSDEYPAPVQASEGTEGQSDELSRADHAHAAIVAPPVAIGVANSEGASTALARADHVHRLQTWEVTGLGETDLESIPVTFDDIGKIARLEVTGGEETYVTFYMLVHVSSPEGSPEGQWAAIAPYVPPEPDLTTKADRVYTPNAQTGTTYTLAGDDSARLVRLTNAAAIAVTVPTNASVPFQLGTVVALLQGGAGQITVSGAGGVTLRNPGLTAKTRQQWSRVTIEKIGTDEWVISGDLATS